MKIRLLPFSVLCPQCLEEGLMHSRCLLLKNDSLPFLHFRPSWETSTISEATKCPEFSTVSNSINVLPTFRWVNEVNIHQLGTIHTCTGTGAHMHRHTHPLHTQTPPHLASGDTFHLFFVPQPICAQSHCLLNKTS